MPIASSKRCASTALTPATGRPRFFNSSLSSATLSPATHASDMMADGVRLSVQRVPQGPQFQCGVSLLRRSPRHRAVETRCARGAMAATGHDLRLVKELLWDVVSQHLKPAEKDEVRVVGIACMFSCKSTPCARLDAPVGQCRCGERLDGLSLLRMKPCLLKQPR